MSLRINQLRRWVWLLGLLLIAGASLAAQGNRPRQLTVASALARFEGTPFTTDDWVVEIIQIDTETREALPALAFWGPDAPAYPLQIRGLRWSFRGNLLAMTFLERDGSEQIAIYDTDEQSLAMVLPSDHDLLDISAVDWSQRGNWLVFSARHPDDNLQVMQVNRFNGETTALANGRLPTLSADDAEVAYLNPNDEISILNIEDEDERTLRGIHPGATSLVWSGDGARLALTDGPYVVTIDVESGQVRRVFDAFVHLNIPDGAAAATTRSVAWSPDNLTLAVILTVTEHPILGNLSQVVGINADDGTTEIYAERIFADDLPDDPRIFLEVSFQTRGAFVPPRESGSDL